MKRSSLLLLVLIALTVIGCGKKSSDGGSNDSVSNSTAKNDTLSKALSAEDDDSIDEDDDDDDDDDAATVMNALKSYILGNTKAVIVTSAAKRDLYETEWPECQCPVTFDGKDCNQPNCGPLFSPNEGSSLKIISLGNNQYKYSVVCPCGCGLTYTDDRVMTAAVNAQGNVELQHVVMK